MNTPTAEPILRIENVSKHFVLHNIDGRTVEALQDVNLTVGPGEHVALAGSSGAGKSTLLRLVYGTYGCPRGSVRFRLASGDWVDIAALTDQDLIAIRGRELGYVSQFLKAQPRRPVIDLVSRAGASRGMSTLESRDAAREALLRLGIGEELWDVHTSVLSGGEKQRVNIAAGLVSPPRLLLLDEPVSALDPANRERAIRVIADLRGQGVSVLAVFHDLDAIERLASRIVVMSAGRIVRDGTVDEVLPSLTPGDVHA